MSDKGLEESLFRVCCTADRNTKQKFTHGKMERKKEEAELKQNEEMIKKGSGIKETEKMDAHDSSDSYC